MIKQIKKSNVIIGQKNVLFDIKLFHNINTNKFAHNNNNNYYEKEDIQSLISQSNMNYVKDKLDSKFIKEHSKYLDKEISKFLTKGFNGYDLCLSIEDFDYNNKEILLKYVRKFIKSLKNAVIYSILINIHDTLNKRSYSMLPHSFLIYNKTDEYVLCNILLKYYNIYLNKYFLIEGSLRLDFLIKEWYSKDRIESIIKDKLNEIKKSSNVKLNNVSKNTRMKIENGVVDKNLSTNKMYNQFIDLINKDLESKNNVNSSFNPLNKDVLKKINNLRKRSIGFRLNPFLINTLPIITGDYYYTLYSLDRFNYLFIKKNKNEIMTKDLLNEGINDKSETYTMKTDNELSLIQDNSKKIKIGYKLLEVINDYKKNYFIIYYKEEFKDKGLISLSSSIIYSWTDYIDYENNLITRQFLNNKIIFKYNEKQTKRKNNLIYFDLNFNFPSFLESGISYKQNNKIGVLDFETLNINNKGEQTVYSGGWKTNNFLYIDFINTNKIRCAQRFNCSNNKIIINTENNNINDNEIKIENENKFKLVSYELIKNLVDSIFNFNYEGYTFYAHNLGNFDFLFIISALSYYGDEYILKPIIKEEGNVLVSLKIGKYVDKFKLKKIYDNKGKFLNFEKVRFKKLVYITLLDSNLILPGKLRDLLKDFNCSYKKEYFPYTFLNKDTLDYNGDIPSYDYFKDSMEIEEYRSFVNSKCKNRSYYKYNIKSESINYLKSDLNSLFELITKFSNIIFEKFNINLTDVKSVSSLALKVYLSNYYNRDFNVKLIKGNIEKDIRNAYFGGLVFSRNGYKHEKKGYAYDVNSQFPSVMMKDMPVGNPILSTSNDLNSYFGFVYAEILPPENLNVYLIPFRTEECKVITPNFKFTGMYFSELLKEAQKYGYKYNIKWGYKFKKKKIFQNFVTDLYNKRLEAKNNNKKSLQKVYKLMLNSLYGRFGMKNIDNKLEIVNKEKADKLLKNKNILFYSELNNKIIVRYNNNINKELINLLNSFDKSSFFAEKDYKIRGTTSSIPIAAAITAYAQAELMKFKNIPDNKLIYSDTDSVFLENKLNDNYVSETELGKMKLENIFVEGIFISPKFYGIKTSSGEVIIKSKGIANSKLTYNDLEKLCKGEDLTLFTTVFKKNLSKGSVSINNTKYLLKGCNSKI